VKYWYDVQAWLPKNMVVVNKAAWEGLDENLQKVVLEAAANAEKAGWDKARELSGWYKDQLAANGMVVEGPSDTLKADFRKIGVTMTTEWLARAGDSGKAVIDAYKAQ
jgi:TRAP-type C4-dicarboxylate transport system substrate-binding protein